jgi:hypothetical protein
VRAQPQKGALGAVCQMHLSDITFKIVLITPYYCSGKQYVSVEIIIFGAGL